MRALMATAFALVVAVPGLEAQTTSNAGGVTQGPFGLTFGSSLEAVSRITGELTETADRMIYEPQTVPEPHSAFDIYILAITPQRGLCKVIAGTLNTDNDAYGTELRLKFETIAGALSMKYGQPTTEVDRLNTGSIWNEPRDWMMALQTGDRSLMSFWKPGGNTGIQIISLKATGTDTDSGYLALTYEGSDYAGCLSEMRTEDRDAL